MIYATLRRPAIEPVLALYGRTHPGLVVTYVNLDGDKIYRRVRADIAARRPSADIIISTAMDLQVKLANDGFAIPHHSAAASALPPWARWRDEAFGISLEPAAMVYNRTVMAGRPLPRSRAELLAAVSADTGFWRGRLGAYDIRRRSVGYLLTSQESRQASDFGALMKSFGTAEVVLEAGGGEMLRDVVSGRLAVGYDVLGSAARREARRGAPIEIVYPRDFTLAVLRTAVIPRGAPHPVDAHVFLDYLLSAAGQASLARDGGLFPIRESGSPAGLDPGQIGVFRPIPLGPGLLVYLDARKRRRLLDNWLGLVTNAPDNDDG